MQQGAVCQNRHYATQSEALEAVEGYISAWEHHAALQNGPDEFRLVFERAEIEDRDPVPGAFHFRAEPVHVRISVGEIGVRVSRGAYPRPPDGRMEFSSGAKLMFERYVRYRAGREYLTSMAYFCLTVLENSVQSVRNRKESLRKAAARQYNVEFSVLKEIGRLCACKGGTEARKKQGAGQELDGQERRFLEEVVKAIIQGAAEVNGDPSEPRHTIGLCDFPDLERNPQ